MAIDFLQDASNWLQDRRKEFYVQDGTGVTASVSYFRGVSSVTLDATIGETIFEEEQEFGRFLRWEMRDYLVTVSELDFGGGPVEPIQGDRIEETVGAKLFNYQVTAPPRTPVFKFSDRFRQTFRIHTKLIKVT